MNSGSNNAPCSFPENEVLASIGRCGYSWVIWGEGSNGKPEGVFPMRKETKLRRVVIGVGSRCSFLTFKKGNLEVVRTY